MGERRLMGKVNCNNPEESAEPGRRKRGVKSERVKNRNREDEITSPSS